MASAPIRPFIPIALYEGALDALPAGVTVYRLDDFDDAGSLRLLYANAAASRVLGLDLQAELGRTMREVFPAVVESGLAAVYAEVARTGKGQDLGDLDRGDDRVKEGVYAVRAFGLPDQSVGLQFDEVTAAREAEAERERERGFLAAVLENVSEGVVACDADGALTLFNRATRVFHGLPEEPLPPAEWAEHYDLQRPDGTPLPTEEIPLFRAWKGEVVRDAPMMIVPKDGPARTLLASGQPIAGPDGRPLGAVVAMHDVTEDLRAQREIERMTEAQRALVESEARYRLLAETATDAIVTIGADNVIRYANPAVEATFGYAPEEVIGRSLELLMPEALRGSHKAALARYLKTGEKRLHWGHVEVPGLRKDGTEVPLAVSFGEYRHDGEHLFTGLLRDVTAQREAEAALRESERLFRALVDHLPQLAWRAGPDGTAEFFNRRWYEYTGIEAGQTTGGRDFVHPDDLEDVVAAWARAVETGEGFEHEYRLRRAADGQYRWQLARAIALRDGAGSVTGWLGTLTDIHDQKEAGRVLEEKVAERTQEARAAYERLDGIINGTTDLIAAVDAEMRVLAFNGPFNAAFEAVYGRPLRVGMGAEEAMPEEPEERERALASWTRVLGGEAFSEAREGEFPGLGFRAFETSYSPIRDEAGRVIGAVSVVRDMTERVLARRAQAEADARYRTVVAAMEEGVVLQDAEAAFVTWNDAAERILGLSADQLAGRTSFDPRWHTVRADGSPFPGEEHPVPVALRTGEPQRDVIMGVHKPTGELTWVSVNAVPLFDSDAAAGDGAPRLTGAVCSFTDVTALKRAEAAMRSYTRELEERNEELGQFAYVASHDLQEPLRMVTSFLQLLERRYGDRLDATGGQYIQYAVDGARRMQQLIQDLLAYSRVGTRGQAFEPVDTQAVVEDVVRDLGPALEEAGAEVVADELPTVEADPTQLHQLFQNLLANALKFRHPERAPRVRIAAQKGRERGRAVWRFHVEDNGIGLEEKYADRVFQIFQRLHTREEYEGTGIGLAICKKIVERHGGSIGYTSRPGEGATFTFTLPVHPERAAAEPPVPPA